ncbi:hypothetical protein [Streptomyces misionensis]|uniref:hypothetical protein n=1 Tax=Streptomyces misionensis TaxID=67331 RepID=UPI0033A84BE2
MATASAAVASAIALSVGTPAIAAPDRQAEPTAHVTTPSLASSPTLEVDTASPWFLDLDRGYICDDSLPELGACFQLYGDHFWVQADAGVSAPVGVYWENWLVTSSGGLSLYRHGRCEDYLGGLKESGCNKDFYEDNTYPNALGGRGSEICIWAEVLGKKISTNPSCTYNDE